MDGREESESEEDEGEELGQQEERMAAGMAAAARLEGAEVVLDAQPAAPADNGVFFLCRLTLCQASAIVFSDA